MPQTPAQPSCPRSNACPGTVASGEGHDAELSADAIRAPRRRRKRWANVDEHDETVSGEDRGSDAADSSNARAKAEMTDAELLLTTVVEAISLLMKTVATVESSTDSAGDVANDSTGITS